MLAGMSHSPAPDHRKLGILTSGGDAPGMNAAIRAATLLAISQGVEVIGIEHGYRGLLDGRMRTLEPPDVSRILREGGTSLGSARCPAMHERDARDVARARLRDAGIECLLVVGGNGSLAGAYALSDPEEDEAPPRVVGIPASIDNDVGLTGLSIGVDTAMNTIVDACDKIHDTASAHDRAFIIEVMGRECGYLAMTAAVASGADAVLFPEAGKSPDDVVAQVVETVRATRRRVGRSKRAIIIQAEGVGISPSELKSRVDERLRAEDGEGLEIETRVTILGHIVRGGRPSAFDRLLGCRLANVAVAAALAGRTRVMTSWMPPLDLPPDVGERSTADPYCLLVDLGAALEATRQLLDGESPLARWRTQVFAGLESVLRL